MELENIQNEKLLILKNFIKLNKDLAKQGTDEWLKARQFIIGGSEISSIIGKNPFSSLQKLIAQKVNLIGFTGNTACNWGNLFENVSENIFKTIFINSDILHNKVYATGSIQHRTIKNHRYSPDGLCCIPFEENGTMVYKTTLLEFKSPYGSIPTKKIPTHYLPQIKAGLCTIDITETGLFINNMFRKCTLRQLDFGINYDTRYHRDNNKKLDDIDAAIANGIIMFSIDIKNLHIFMDKYNKLVNVSNDYNSDDSDDEMVTKLHRLNPYIDFISVGELSESESESEEYLKHFDDGTNILYKIYKNILNYKESITTEDKINNLSKNMIDLGNETGELFNQFLALYKSEDNINFIDIKCIKPQINKDALCGNLPNFILPQSLNYIKNNLDICKKYSSKKLISAYVKDCVDKERIPIGYLPWKLLRSSNIIIEKDPEYLNLIKDDIDNCINIVKDITINSKNMDDTANLFEKYFQDNDITKKYFESKGHSVDFIKEFL